MAINTLGVYLYGVVPSHVTSEPPHSPGVDGGQGVAFLVQGALGIAVAQVPLDEFSITRVRQLLRAGETRWVEEKALAHAAVLQELMQRGPVVPVRFGTLFHDQRRLLSLVASQESDISELLGRLAGRAEWGLKVWCPGQPARDALMTEDPDLADLQRGVAAMPEGAAYLYQKRLALLMTRKLEERRTSWASRITTTLAAACEEAAELPLLAEQWGKEQVPIHQGAYMVEDRLSMGFRAEVELLAGRMQANGLRFDLSGPWPPYHFSRLRLEGS